MATMRDLATPVENTWCPGCGNFGILMAMKRAIIQLGLEREKVVAITGIGCHGKVTNYIKVNGVHVIHGRVLPAATAIKLANQGLTVIGFAGDGDAYNIGMGHLSHAARRNPDITYVVHNNLIYALTTGQTSPTSERGFRTKSTPRGAFELAINPITQALASEASFVARGYAGDMHHLTELFKEAITHRGFALVDVLQPCVAWNRVNTYDFFRERVYKLKEAGHDPTDLKQVYDRAVEWKDRIPIGVFYRVERPTYRENFPVLSRGPLVRQRLDDVDVSRLMKEFA
ncbi:MAG: thiamine pyrophosphate-dependent enzyme [Candidatus Bathyarchaeota archaeon]|nr:thiamine pyrophosphate-dependent enzyme [Candidatus Bathyarchaeota archaeon]